jgi:glucosamine-6-phosphate deaminase
MAHISTQAGTLHVNIYATRLDSGTAAAADISSSLRATLASRTGPVRVIFASAPSQREVLSTLSSDTSIDWSRIHAFHMDEYIGLPNTAPQCFAEFLRKYLWQDVKPGVICAIDGNATDIDAECARYSKLLAEAPIDVVVLGIGENGHLAFNDPPNCDIYDTRAVCQVTLPISCINQQVNDGAFVTVEQVPKTALTLTVPALLRGTRIFCIVPGPTKTAAIRATLTAQIDNNCPATTLRTHLNATLYVDDAACPKETLLALAEINNKQNQ